MSDNVDINVRSGYDSLLTEIAQYVSDYDVNSDFVLSGGGNDIISVSRTKPLIVRPLYVPSICTGGQACLIM